MNNDIHKQVWGWYVQSNSKAFSGMIGPAPILPAVLAAVFVGLAGCGARTAAESSAAQAAKPVESRTTASTGRAAESRAVPPGVGSPVSVFSPAGGDTALRISAYVRRVYQDRRGHLWFGTNDDGVCRYDGISLRYFTKHDGFGGRAVRGIVEDRAGNLWFATDAGVIRYDGKSFTTFTVSDGLRDNNVWSILHDRDGILWFGTNGGVSRYDGKVIADFGLPPANRAPIDYPTGNRSSATVWSMVQDRAGTIWFGTNGGGVVRYDGRVCVRIAKREGLPSDFVWSILEDRGDKLWFGTSSGVARFDGTTFSTLTVKDGLCHDFVWTLLQDSDGNIWFGTAGGGASRYNGTTFTNFSANDGLASQHVQSIMQDNAGRLWFGCSGGLFRFTGKSFIHITRNGPW